LVIETEKVGLYWMVNQSKPGSETTERYEIHLKGILGSEWSEWFDGMMVTSDGQGNTILTGPVADQAALHGVLDRVRDSGLTLLSINIINQ
jgi:hypothetical protein